MTYSRIRPSQQQQEERKVVQEVIEEDKLDLEEQDTQEEATQNPESKEETSECDNADSNNEVENEVNKESKKEKSNKSIFGKEKKEKKDPRDEKIEELNDRLIRNMAEFDNFRKRTDKEKSQMFEMGAKDIVEKILPVVDNFERGLGTITEEEKEGAFAQGIEKIYKQLLTTLEEAGVKAIEAVGKEFDPNLHNAVMHAEDENFGENTITDEFLKGYTYRDTVVRHSMVKVVN